jgi:hypothetical protein
MSYRTIASIAAAAILGIACVSVSSESFARGARAGTSIDAWFTGAERLILSRMLCPAGDY